MTTFRDFFTGLRQLELDPSWPMIAHASLSAFGEVHGGAGTVLGALLGAFHSLVMPAFTFKTMVTPESGPENNGLSYGSGKDLNRMAEFYHAEMPADRLIGRIAETLRTRAGSERSFHPILSFTGINAKEAIAAQTLPEPLAPIGTLLDGGGWVLLLGVDHTVNTSIHYAEKLAGRKQFIRWALTPRGILQCPGFPGCSAGFQAISTRLGSVTRKVQIGPGVVQAIPLHGLVETVVGRINEDPLALLCAREDCERCNAVREAFSARGT
jgi:aminoglycoside 3-N-acetyltransferase